MKIHNRQYLLTLSLLTLLVSIIYAVRAGEDKVNLSGQSTFPVTHYRQADIEPGRVMYPPRTVLASPTQDIPRGGIVAHHLLAGAYIARYFQELSQYEYRRIIVIGPDHYGKAAAHIVTSQKSWDTPYGIVERDKSCHIRDIPDDDFVLSSDHAIEVLMPYIKVYIPTAKVVPILLGAHTTREELDILATSLKGCLNDKTLVLVSSDFSHYLKVEEARKRDQMTQRLINDWKLEEILRLDSRNIDSPPSVVLLMKLMKDKGAQEIVEFDHADATTISETPQQPTTTYFFILFKDSK